LKQGELQDLVIFIFHCDLWHPVVDVT
jgi:hypothetical protein